MQIIDVNYLSNKIVISIYSYRLREFDHCLFFYFDFERCDNFDLTFIFFCDVPTDFRLLYCLLSDSNRFVYHE